MKPVLLRACAVACMAALFVACGDEPEEPVPTECTTGATRSCGTAVGECSLGIESCVAGRWSGRCEGGVEPTTERCNLVDDDCDGVADGATAACEDRPFQLASRCEGGTCWIGECVAGRADCNGEIADGCETETSENHGNCGACRAACDADQTCEAGTCRQLPQTQHLWTVSGTFDEEPLDVALASDGHVWLVARTNRRASIGELEVPPPPTLLGGIFVTRVAPDGTAAWAHVLQSPEILRTWVAVAIDGAAYVVGHYRASFAVGDVTVTASPAGSNQIVVARIEPSGAVAWAISTSGGPGFEVRDAATLSDGALVIGGLLRGTVSIGETSRTSVGEGDVGVIGIAPTGSVRWFSAGGGAGLQSADALAIDDDDRVWVGGALFGAATFGAITVTPTAAQSGALLRLSSDGEFESAWTTDAVELPYVDDVAVSDGHTYLLTRCATAGPVEIGEARIDCRSDDIVVLALAEDGTLRWSWAERGSDTRVGRAVAAYGAEAVAVVVDTGVVRVSRLDDAGRGSSWSFPVEGSIYALDVRGSSLAITGTFEVIARIESQYVTAVGGTDIFVWAGRVR